MVQIGEKLRQRAQALGLADAEVARRLDISPSRYGNYVANIREPDFATLLRICGVLETDPNHILGFAGNPVSVGDKKGVLDPVDAMALFTKYASWLADGVADVHKAGAVDFGFAVQSPDPAAELSVYLFAHDGDCIKIHTPSDRIVVGTWKPVASRSVMAVFDQGRTLFCLNPQGCPDAFLTDGDGKKGGRLGLAPDLKHHLIHVHLAIAKIEQAGGLWRNGLLLKKPVRAGGG